MPSVRAMIASSLITFCAMVLEAQANADPGDANLCLQAAANAADQTGVPYDVLLAISVVETGRDGQPWPWTVGIAGEGQWSDTAEDAANLVYTALQAGVTNVDIGCFQLNLYWHAGAFQSVEDMLDPSRNAAYAAEFLAEKYAETGDWSAAAAAYHSATPEYAVGYEARFDETWTKLAGTEPGPPPLDEARPNRFPLLMPGQGGSAGSLVPATSGGIRLIGDP